MPGPLSYDDKELLLFLLKDEKNAFTLIYDKYKKRVFQLALNYIQDREDAVEITQQVFVRLWERRASLTGVNVLRDYILVTARNAIFDYLKKLGRQASLISSLKRSQPEYGNNPEEILQLKILSDIWQGIVQQLPAQQNHVYRLIEQQGISLDKVAEMLILSKPTVKKHLELARRYVRIEMQKQLLEKGISKGS